MSLTNEDRILLVAREYKKAEDFYIQATLNADLGIWDVVANRLYYSAFHAVCALLVQNGYKVGTHRGAAAQFGLHFVVTGLFSQEEGSFYSRLQSIREKADYSLSWNAEDVDLKAALTDTQAFLAHIKQHIQLDCKLGQGCE